MSDQSNHPTLHIGSEPALIASFIKSRQESTPSSATSAATPPYSFADFVTDMGMIDMGDAYAIRATLESQIQLLGTAFNYLMLEGDWKHLKSTLRAQKMMRDTLQLMNYYPPLSAPSLSGPIRNTTDGTDSQS